MPKRCVQPSDHSNMRNEEWIGELQINGVYRLENGNPSGNLRSRWQGTKGDRDHACPQLSEPRTTLLQKGYG